MGILFTPRPKLAYVPPPAGGQPTLLGAGDAAQSNSQPPAPATPSAPSREAGRNAVIRDLPGVGRTYLDSEFAPRLDQFIQNARNKGVNLEFESAYRSPEYQKYLREQWRKYGANGTGLSYEPAEKSRHSTGLAVDIKGYKDMHPDTQNIVREAAKDAQLTWGGTYPKPDIVHFEYLPPGFDFDSYVDSFSNAIRAIQK